MTKQSFEDRILLEMNERSKKGGGCGGSSTSKRKTQTPTLLFLKGGGGIMTQRYREQSKGKSRKPERVQTEPVAPVFLLSRETNRLNYFILMGLNINYLFLASWIFFVV